MLDSELFEALDGIARAVRNVDAPFGGIQLVAVGDFFQLPPVGLGGPYNKGFAFEARAWERAGLSPLRPGCVVLETCVRQQNDRAFVGLLNEIRDLIGGRCFTRGNRLQNLFRDFIGVDETRQDGIHSDVGGPLSSGHAYQRGQA